MGENEWTEKAWEGWAGAILAILEKITTFRTLLLKIIFL